MVRRARVGRQAAGGDLYLGRGDVRLLDAGAGAYSVRLAAVRLVAAPVPAPGVVTVKILYVSGNIGLGHITRDLAVAEALRSRRPDVEICWLAAEPSASVLRAAGERLHPAAAGVLSETAAADRVTVGSHLNLLTYAFAASREWLANALLVRRLLRREPFDVVVGDETYELLVAQIVHLLTVPAPFVMIYDFLGLDAMTPRWSERLGTYFWNVIWSRDRTVLAKPENRGVFIGEVDDVPESRFGPLLPSRRRHAEKLYDFVGYVLPFDGAAISDRARLRAELGYGPEPLVVCAVGGTAAGRALLELCGQAQVLLTAMVPGLRMVLVCGPSIPTASVHVPDGVEVRGLVPELYRHFAASDLAVVQCGGTTTLELTALQRPFLYFPVEGQCEQNLTVAARLARHGAGIRMSLAATTPTTLAEAITRHLGATVTYPPIPVDGAARIADVVLDLGSSQRIGASVAAAAT